jgi:hypothetical protein
MTPDLSDDGRRAIFAALVDAQDEGQSVASSREQVAARYGISVEQVQAIEREGLDHGWPPLG